MEVAFNGYRMLVPDADVRSDYLVAEALLRAYAKYRQRNTARKGVWERAGVKKQVHECYAKAERAMVDVEAGELPDIDHLEDLIVYACFAQVLMTADKSALTVDERLYGQWPWGRHDVREQV